MGDRFVAEVYTLPSAWASYLINGDATGISDEDRRQADMFIEWLGLGAPVDCQDAGFCWRHDAFTYLLGADCQEYTFLRPAVPPFTTANPYEGP